MTRRDPRVSHEKVVPGPVITRRLVPETGYCQASSTVNTQGPSTAAPCEFALRSHIVYADASVTGLPVPLNQPSLRVSDQAGQRLWRFVISYLPNSSGGIKTPGVLDGVKFYKKPHWTSRSKRIL
ncbi:hypothetical protein NUW54_g6395 [Trametes sanguinea]|nr:hypothetical protein NUW54_g6395 [Trametes sanguinea]